MTFSIVKNIMIISIISKTPRSYTNMPCYYCFIKFSFCRRKFTN